MSADSASSASSASSADSADSASSADSADSAEPAGARSGATEADLAHPLPRLMSGAAAVFLMAALVLRTFVSGLAAEFERPGANALVTGAFALSALLALGARFLARQRGQRAPAVLPDRGLDLPLVIFLVSLAIGVGVASQLDIALRTALRYAGSVLGFVALLSLMRDRETLARLWLSGLILAALVALLALKEVWIDAPASLAAFEAGDMDLSGMTPGQQAEFEARLRSKGAVGPFLIANLLGGFLSMWWPLAAAAAVAAWRRGAKSLGGAFAALTLLLVVGMGLSHAKGMIVSSMAGLWALLFFWPESRPEAAAESESADPSEAEAEGGWTLRRKALLGLLAAGALVAIGGLALFARNPESFGVGLSLQVRLEYWTAGARMFRKAPLAGVGLNNFRSHYSAEKPERSEETRFAHNSLVQVAADQGLIGVIAWALLFVMLVKVALRPMAELPESAPAGVGEARAPPKAWLLGWLLGGFLVASSGDRYGAGSIGELIATVVLAGAAGLAAQILAARPAGQVSREALRAGALAGFIAFLGHGLFDFSLHTPGLWVGALLLIAVAIRSAGAELESEAEATGGRERLWTALILLGLPLVAIWPGRMQAYSGAVELGADTAKQALQAWHEGARERSLELWREAEAEFARATTVWPLAPRSWQRLGAARESIFKLNGSKEALEGALAAYGKALKQDPRAADLHAQQAELLELAARSGLPVDPERLLALRVRAVELYPTHPVYRYEEARLRAAFAEQIQGRNPTRAREMAEQARAGYRAALAADEQARLERVKLSEDQRAKARAAVGGAGG